jgi:hypothetical protein
MSENEQGQPMSEAESRGEPVVDEASRPEHPVPGRSWTRWVLPVVGLLGMVALGLVLWQKMHSEVWSYYTDDEGLRVDVQEKKERLVLWEDPQQSLFEEKKSDPANPGAVDPVNRASERVEAAFSADGTTMVLTRWSKDFEKTDPEETGADLYLSTWDGRRWSRPAPMVDLNTSADERGAAFSRDGRHLYFSSDRQGGAGGYDIYVARKSGRSWTGIARLGDSVNSEWNETGPALSTDARDLYFSSDRGAGDGAQDIYVARRVVTATDTKDPEAAAEPESKADKTAAELPPVPVFSRAEPVSTLNSSADDIEAVLTGRGDHVFLASDRDRDHQSGFNLYLSRVVGGRVRSPQKVDIYIEKGNATDPAVRMEGFDLLFSSDGDLAAGPAVVDPPATEAAPETAYRLYRSTTREVVGYTDLSRWNLFKELIGKIIWWILLALAALILLIYLLERWRDITSLYHKCLAGSVIVHLLLLLLLAYWLISQALEGGDQQSPEVTLSIDALAQEELAMESEQELVEVTRSTQLIVAKNVQNFREVAFNPAEVATNPIPIPRQTSDQSLVSDFTPSKASESTSTETVLLPQADTAVLEELTATELPDLLVEELEVADATSAREVEAVDPTRDEFKRDEEAIQQVKTDKEQINPTRSRKVEVQSDARSVASSSKPEPSTDTVNPVVGLEAEDSPRKVEGTEKQLARNLPGDDPVDALSTGLELEVAEVDPTKGDFKGDEEAIQQVKTGKGKTGPARNQKVEVQSDARSVAPGGKPTPTIDTGGDTIHPVDGLEADSSPPQLEGVRLQVALAMNLPGTDPVDSLVAKVKLETPENSLDAKALGQYVKKRHGKPSLEVIKQLGGSSATEGAIGRGLDWFSDHQEPDGHWEMSKHGSKAEYNTAGAGIALLCYYGWGIKHGAGTRHSKALSKGLDWLLKQQRADGDLRGTRGNHGMYAHGIATIALCEAYGLTTDPKIEAPARRAIDFILDAQHPGGGWRYQPRQAGDLSVTSWHYMALHSARMADIEVPDEAFEKARVFIAAVSGGTQGGLYGYTGPSKNHPAMTATGMFLRQLDLVPPTDHRMQESAAFLKGRMLKVKTVDFYYDYYATLSLYQHQGPIWREWNKNLKEVYVTLQQTTGPDKGSWDPKGSHVNAGGRVLATGLAVLSLEVYYRLLPLYGFGRD